MKVSIQLNTTTLRDVDFDTALALSAALRGLPSSDVDAVIMVEDLAPRARPARPSRPQWPGFLHRHALPARTNADRRSVPA